MSTTDENKPLSGLARSIDSLFPGAESVEEGSREEPRGEVSEPTEEEVTDELLARRDDPASTWFDADGPRTGRRREYRLVKSDLYMDVEFEDVDEEGAGPEDGADADAVDADAADAEDGTTADEAWAEPFTTGDEPVSAPRGEGAEPAAGDEVESPADVEAAPPGPAPAGEAEDEVGPAPPEGGLEAPRIHAYSHSQWVVAAVDDFAGAVEEYLGAEGYRRDELSRRIRELSAKLRTLSEPEAIADAVERLIIQGRRSGGQEAPVALAEALVTPDVATVLVARLGSARDEERRRQLVEVVHSAHAELAPVVAEALAATDDRAARRAYIEALVGLGDDAREVVAEMVDDPRWFVVRNAVLILGEIGGQAGVQHLTTTLGNDDGRVRRETLVALTKIGGEDASMLVQSKLDDPDPEVRWAAVRAAGELRVERALRPLLAQLEEESEQEVEVAILRTLGQLGDPGAVAAIEKRAVKGFFSRSATEVRVAAYRALGAIGTPHAISLLQAATGDRDDAVAAAATEALERTRSD